ncbi:aminoglycoside 3'-phosphotransferase [Lederbergia sp. NSJ-179]|uniref:APH(3') family aminoglycoside O-phosphotransferase n=1 Tax=Lederbergia sp. NSJ-179 TaxID=2931402 RepID=UPI001FD41719|nr:APH(3') family aminoglycoside O-phosphotransferase [Lederbergia sp. NSJ-179]MCJ7839790.1 aminoglycoside 3'-phosphotransferase [Lederbergia sp. NSJ-179]
MNTISARLKKIIKGYTWQQVTIGHSEASTFLLKKGNHSLYLKTQSTNASESIRNEKEKMEWLQGKLAVPEVLYYEEDEKKEYLLMTEIKGINASDSSYQNDLPLLIKLLAKGLREIHSIGVDHCPFQCTLDVTIREAQERVEKNLVDIEDFDEERKGKSAEELFQEVLEKRPLDEELVFTHGDYCLPNIILQNDEVSGFIDLGRAGVSDRYQDIALAAWSIAHNVGKQHIPLFLKEYGLEEVNQDKIYFYQLLDEFF